MSSRSDWSESGSEANPPSKSAFESLSGAKAQANPNPGAETNPKSILSVES